MEARRQRDSVARKVTPSEALDAAKGEVVLSLERMRKIGISESLSATGLPHKNDIAKLSQFCSELEPLLAARYPDWELCLFCHIGDGNLHVNIMKPDALGKDEFLKRTHTVDADMFALVKKHQGSVSAEHGIGLLKKEWLGHTRSATELSLMKQLKQILDPGGLLNPGKVL